MKSWQRQWVGGRASTVIPPWQAIARHDATLMARGAGASAYRAWLTLGLHHGFHPLRTFTSPGNPHHTNNRVGQTGLDQQAYTLPQSMKASPTLDIPSTTSLHDHRSRMKSVFSPAGHQCRAPCLAFALLPRTGIMASVPRQSVPRAVLQLITPIDAGP